MSTFKVVYINCDEVPFVDSIISMDKVLETRTRNMLQALVGRHILLAETHRGRRPVIRCWATIGHPLSIRSREEWEKYRNLACIPSGSKYDWQPDTSVKWLYPLYDVRACEPHTVPEGVEIIRHGRTWFEY